MAFFFTVQVSVFKVSAKKGIKTFIHKIAAGMFKLSLCVCARVCVCVCVCVLNFVKTFSR